MRWQVLVPTLGLLLFAGETRNSDREWKVEPQPRRYFWWAFIRLDSDPLNRHLQHVPVQKPGDENPTTWELRGKIVDPGYLTESCLVSGLPAFLASKFIAVRLSRFGVSQVLSFMVFTPLLLFAWYYFLGWLLDRWRARRHLVNT